jgi:hypothetical protein
MLKPRRARIEGDEGGEPGRILEELGRLQEGRLAARRGDQLEADRPAVGSEAAG